MGAIITKLLNGNVYSVNAPGEFSLPGDMQVLKDIKQNACVVRDKSGSRQHVYIAADVEKVVRRDGVETFIGGDNDVLFYELINFFFFKLGSNGSVHLGVFDNYTDLITQYPTAGTGDLAYVENSQGFPWLPGPVFGTYYSKGVYLFNGAFWDSSVDEIANQIETNINDISSLQTVVLNHVTDLANPHQTSDVNLLFSDVTTNNSSTLQHGFLPKLSGVATQYLNGLGLWSTPSGGGGSEPIIITNVPPTVNDDSTGGYFVGQRWVDTTDFRTYMAQDVSVGAAIWKEITPVGGITTGDGGEIVIESGVSLGTAITQNVNANTNNLIVPNIETAIVLRINTTGNYSLTGLVPFNTTSAWMVFMANVGIGNLTLKNNDAASSAANRFLIGGNKTIQTDEGILLFYDPVSNRWRGSGILI